MNAEAKFTGEVVSFKKTYGFISRGDERDIFVHYSDIESEGFRTLKAGQRVAYSIGVNNHGEPKAINVVIIDE